MNHASPNDVSGGGVGSTNTAIVLPSSSTAIASGVGGSDVDAPLAQIKDAHAHLVTALKKNKSNVRCQFCGSLILKEQQGEYVESEFELPLMHQKHAKEAAAAETEAQCHFWLVNDMFSFENIGFSNTVANRKFLTCADCDMGPIGYHEIDNKNCYIALKRVRHGDATEEAPAATLEQQ